jgi:hypothetical protein
MTQIATTDYDETGVNSGVVTRAAQAFQDASVNPGTKTQAEQDEAEMERLRSYCADYKAHAPHWRFMLRSYEGGPDYVNEDTLFKHPREVQQDYLGRVKRAYFSNYCQPLTDFVPEYIFSQDVERQAPAELKDAFEQFKINCDRNGTALNTFMQIVGEDMRIFGMVYIMVDKPAIPANRTGVDLSVAEAKDLGVDQPYFVLVRPLEVLDWRVSDLGNLIYLKRVQRTCNVEGEAFRDVERYTEWRADQIKISEIDVTDPKDPKLKRGTWTPNPLTVIPFIPVFYKRSKSNRDLGQSFLQDIAYQNRAVFNQTSLIDEFLYRQCVTGDTLIDCPRDLEKYPHGIPIRELVGKEFQTYAWSIEKKKYVLRRAYDVRKTGALSPVYRLTFEYRDEYNQPKNGHLDATAGHPVLTQSGKYVDLAKLHAGDRLVPFYRWVDGYPRGNRPHILQGLSPYSGIAEHRFIAGESDGGLKTGYEVHHVDERSLNNEPSNLVQITKLEHSQITAANSKRKSEWWANATEDEKRYVLDKAHSGIAEWRKNDPSGVARRNKKQSETIRRTLSRLSADDRRAKVNAALEARGVAVEAVNHRVVSVQFLGYEDVYNLEVEDCHNYVANGIVVHNCFNILAVPTSGQVKWKEQIDGDIGTGNVLEIPENATHKPEYIVPSAEPAKFIQAEREQTVREMYRQAAQDVMSELMTPGRQTGQSSKQQFSRTIPVINKTADALQYAERRAMHTWAQVQGKDWNSNGKISYKDDYSITNLLDMLAQLTIIFNSLHLLSPTFVKEEWKRIVREMDGKIDQNTMMKIFAEIDSTNAEHLVQLFLAQPNNGKAENGQPSTSNLMQGFMQHSLGSDAAIGAASGSKAATKEVLSDANQRTETASQPSA